MRDYQGVSEGLMDSVNKLCDFAILICVHKKLILF